MMQNYCEGFFLRTLYGIKNRFFKNSTKSDQLNLNKKNYLKEIYINKTIKNIIGYNFFDFFYEGLANSDLKKTKFLC